MRHAMVRRVTRAGRHPGPRRKSRPMMNSYFPLLVEPGMYFAIGFLLAALLSLPFMGAIHHRAVRLTGRHLDANLPTSVGELRAEKDLLRSEFAVTTTRLRSTLQDMQGKTAAQRVEISRQGTVVTTLKTELREKARTIAALEARETALKDQLRETEHEHALKSISLDDARRVLANKEVELAQFAATLDDRDVIADHQSFELVRAQVNVEALKVTVEELNDELEGLNTRLTQARDDSERATHELAQERGKVENLGRRLADLEIELITQRNEAEALSKVTADRIGDQARVLAAREYEGDRLRVALESAHRAEAALRYEYAQVEERRLLEGKAALAAKAALEIQVDQLKQERQKLQGELQALRRHAESSHASERVESALMRTRINEVSDQVAQLRALLLTPMPPDEVDVDVTRPVNGSANGNGLNGHGLADYPSFADLEVETLRDDEQAAAPSPITN
jgi:predicted  nucleic acid-binding Zn-ribbon protein